MDVYGCTTYVRHCASPMGLAHCVPALWQSSEFDQRKCYSFVITLPAYDYSLITQDMRFPSGAIDQAATWARQPYYIHILLARDSGVLRL